MNAQDHARSPSDSGIASDFTTDLESITSSNYEFQTLSTGRRRHGFPANRYYLPADEREATRLDDLQYCIHVMHGQNILAPVRPSQVLDIGTGSGLWAIEVAEDHPNASVIGMDLSPIQPQSVPRNCEFIVGDLTQDLDGFNTASFDLVHSRIVHAGVTKGQWRQYIQETNRMLLPGRGWAQFAEMSRYTIHNPAECPATVEFFDHFERLHHSKDLYAFEGSDFLVPLFWEFGFVDVKVITKSLDKGDWRKPKDSKDAETCRLFLNTSCDAIPAIVAEIAEADPEAVPDQEEFVEKIIEEFKSGKAHLTYNLDTVIARRPAIDEGEGYEPRLLRRRRAQR